jgi:ubiquinone/menaquinone biosynthesis C-methylase UbiE
MWSRVAAFYDPLMSLSGWHRAQAGFGEGLREVLDVGCGTAFLASVVGPGYIGVDREVAMLARARGPRVMAADARMLPFRDRSVDTVVSTGFLGLVPPGVRAQILLEMARVCRHDVRVLEPIAGVTRAPVLTLSRAPIQQAEFAKAGLQATIGSPVYFGLYAPVVARPVRL